jgi:hypothetical protein
MTKPVSIETQSGKKRAGGASERGTRRREGARMREVRMWGTKKENLVPEKEGTHRLSPKWGLENCFTEQPFSPFLATALL